MPPSHAALGILRHLVLCRYIQIESFNSTQATFNVTRPKLAPHQLLTSLLNETFNSEKDKMNQALKDNQFLIPSSWGADHFPSPQVKIEHSSASDYATAMTACTCNTHYLKQNQCTDCGDRQDVLSSNLNPLASSPDALTASQATNDTLYTAYFYSDITGGSTFDCKADSLNTTLKVLTGLQNTNGLCYPNPAVGPGVTGTFYSLNVLGDGSITDASFFCVSSNRPAEWCPFLSPCSLTERRLEQTALGTASVRHSPLPHRPCRKLKLVQPPHQTAPFLSRRAMLGCVKRTCRSVRTARP